MRGIRALQKAGIVGEVGVSNASLAQWLAAERAMGGRVLSNQVGYSLITRSAEQDLLPFAKSHGRMVIAYRPLELGLLSGRYHRGNRPVNQIRTGAPLFLPQNLERIGGLITVLRDIADGHGATPAQVALAWVIRHPAVAAIPAPPPWSNWKAMSPRPASSSPTTSTAPFRPPRRGSTPSPGPASCPARPVPSSAIRRAIRPRGRGAAGRSGRPRWPQIRRPARVGKADPRSLTPHPG